MANQENTKTLSSTPSLLSNKLRSAAAIPAICLFYLVCLFAFSCATRPVAIKPDDPLFGTWVNDQHDKLGSSFFAKRVIFPDGRELDFDYIADTEPSRESRNTIDKTWIDAEGNHWYRIHIIGWQYTNQELKVERFALSRINAQGTVLEQLNAKYDYPEELNPTEVNYTIYYKQ
jgi:hypothetical protein